jgi:hypothetical protein
VNSHCKDVGIFFGDEFLELEDDEFGKSVTGGFGVVDEC